MSNRDREGAGRGRTPLRALEERPDGHTSGALDPNDPQLTEEGAVEASSAAADGVVPANRCCRSTWLNS